jgi:hypothetical protein
MHFAPKKLINVYFRYRSFWDRFVYAKLYPLFVEDFEVTSQSGFFPSHLTFRDR